LIWRKHITAYEENLWQALEKTNVNQSITNIIKNIYHNNKCRIKIRSNLVEFCNTKGLQHGCPISPALFKLYTDKALREWYMKCKLVGFKTGKDCYVHKWLFTDNQVVVTQGVENDNNMGRKPEEE
jgi:hypothetical protein